MVRRSLHDARNIARRKRQSAPPLKCKNRVWGPFIELLSTCPTECRYDQPMPACGSRDYMIPQYPIGDFRVSAAVEDLAKGG